MSAVPCAHRAPQPDRPLRLGARVNAKGQHITVPLPDLHPKRLALRRFSWDAPKGAARP